MLFFYIRHGEPIYNPDSLTEFGEKQADALSKRLAVYGLDKIYASTSNRALQTAAPTAKKLNLPVEKLDWCNEGYVAEEFNSLKREGKWSWCFLDKNAIKLFLTKEIRDLGQDWRNSPHFEGLGYKRGIERVEKESDEFFKNLGFVHDREKCVYYKNGEEKYKRVALFAHQGFGFAFLSSILDIPYPYFCTHFDFGHSSMSVIEFTDYGDYVVPRMLQLSNDSHVYKEGLMLKYQSYLEF